MAESAFAADSNDRTEALRCLATILNQLPSCPMKAYSEDLGEKIVEAAGRDLGKIEVARTFRISLSSVKRCVKTARVMAVAWCRTVAGSSSAAPPFSRVKRRR